MGYLTYDRSTGEAWIPNKEVRQEFINCIEDDGWEEVMDSIRKELKLYRKTEGIQRRASACWNQL